MILGYMEYVKPEKSEEGCINFPSLNNKIRISIMHVSQKIINNLIFGKPQEYKNLSCKLNKFIWFWIWISLGAESFLYM